MLELSDDVKVRLCKDEGCRLLGIPDKTFSRNNFFVNSDICYTQKNRLNFLLHTNFDAARSAGFKITEDDYDACVTIFAEYDIATRRLAGVYFILHSAEGCFLRKYTGTPDETRIITEKITAACVQYLKKPPHMVRKEDFGTKNIIEGL